MGFGLEIVRVTLERRRGLTESVEQLREDLPEDLRAVLQPYYYRACCFGCFTRASQRGDVLFIDS